MLKQVQHDGGGRGPLPTHSRPGIRRATTRKGPGIAAGALVFAIAGDQAALWYFA
jgi:hypothetical protein